LRYCGAQLSFRTASVGSGGSMMPPANGRNRRIAADRSPEQENPLSSPSGKSARHRFKLLRAPHRAWRIREDLFSLNNAVGPSSAVAASPAEAEHVEARRAIFTWIQGPRA
jgi:hypothetical protein